VGFGALTQGRAGGFRFSGGLFNNNTTRLLTNDENVKSTKEIKKKINAANVLDSPIHFSYFLLFHLSWPPRQPHNVPNVGQSVLHRRHHRRVQPQLLRPGHQVRYGAVRAEVKSLVRECVHGRVSVETKRCHA
jgi:hypothetical protein